ncbi:MAG: patatin-like phospholipase family protein [Burkholderiales bacterium]|nr:patatin-like phospholipase family protein [Burkholderiales bacterium]
MPAVKTLRILSLAGGGYLGLFTAQVLAALEERVGEPLGRRFDLIAGTSVGGILALGLAFEVPMRTMVELFVDKGQEVFSTRALPNGRVARLWDLSRSVLGPKYSGEALRAELTAALGARTLGQALHNVVVPAVNVTRSLTKVFKTPHGAASRGDEAVRAVDVAMATCAAPAYFPAVRIDADLYADGGMFAVAPDQVALHEAEHFMGVNAAQLRMLSIGTATAGYQPAGGVAIDDGAVGWLSDGRLLLTLASVQQQHVMAMMEDRLGDRYLRIDAPWPARAGLGIDVATREAAQTLIGLAAGAMQALDPRRLEPWLGNDVR